LSWMPTNPASTRQFPATDPKGRFLTELGYRIPDAINEGRR